MPSLKAERRIRPGSREGLAAALGWLPARAVRPSASGRGSRRAGASRIASRSGSTGRVRPCRVGAHAHASPPPPPRPARDPAHPVRPAPSARAPPGERGQGAPPAPPRRRAGTRRVRQSARAFAARPGRWGRSGLGATPAPGGSRPAPSPLGSRRSVPAASGGAGRPGQVARPPGRRGSSLAARLQPPSEHAQCRPQAAPAPAPAGRDGPARRAGGGRPERPAGRPRPHPGPVRSHSSPRGLPRSPAEVRAARRRPLARARRRSCHNHLLVPTVCPALDFMPRNVKQPALNKYLKWEMLPS